MENTEAQMDNAEIRSIIKMLAQAVPICAAVMLISALCLCMGVLALPWLAASMTVPRLGVPLANFAMAAQGRASRQIVARVMMGGRKR